MTQQLGTLSAFIEDLCPHMAVTPVLVDLMPSSDFHGQKVCMCCKNIYNRKNTYTHKINKFKK